MPSEMDSRKHDFFTENTEETENLIIVTKIFIYKKKPETNNDIGTRTSKQVADYILSLERSSATPTTSFSSKSVISKDSRKVFDDVSEISTFVLDKNKINTDRNKNSDIRIQDTPSKKIMPKTTTQKRKLIQNERKPTHEFKIPETPVRMHRRKLLQKLQPKNQSLSKNVMSINYPKKSKNCKKVKNGLLNM